VSNSVSIPVNQNAIRRVIAWVATGFGIATQVSQTIHLPVALSAILTAFAPVVESMEHWSNLNGPSSTPTTTS
jgi:hypothetical protein